MVNVGASQFCIAMLIGRKAGVFLLGILFSAMASAQAPPVAEKESGLLEEVIVTARKIAENVQDIPMNVQVLSGDFLAEAGLTRLYEMQFNIPGLVVNSVGVFGAGFALRGISDQGGTSLSVATHLNGVYQGNASLATTRVFDMERIEVLKGPQGTLYGRNSTGGSINLITMGAQEESSSGFEAAYGSFETVRAQGHVNLPFEKTAVRIAFIGSEGDGYIDNSVDDRKFAESDFWGIRGSLAAEPSDKLQVNVMAQHVRDDGASGELWGPHPAYLPDPENIWLTTVVLDKPFLVTESDNINLDAEYDLGFAKLVSRTGYARVKTRDRDDCAGTPVLQGCVRSFLPYSYDQWSEEIQLVSQSEAALEWLVGLSMFKNDASYDYYLNVPGLDPQPLNNSTSTSAETAYAVFGQASLQVAGRWRITGGLRLNHEKTRVSDIGTGLWDHPALTVSEGDWSNDSWRFDLEFAAKDAMLVYAGISTGFKSGGITTEKLPNGEFDSFGPENLTAFESGVKSRWMDGRLTLNGSFFYYNFRDMQVNSLYFEGSMLVNEIDNAAKARVYGADVEGAFFVNDRLILTGGVVWMPEREFVEFMTGSSADELAGNKISRAPEWSGTMAVNYSYPWRGQGYFSIRLEYNFRSEFFFTKENDPWFAQDGFGLLNVFLRFAPGGGKRYVFAAGRNLANEQYFNQVLFQSSPGYPVNYEAGFGFRF